MRNSLVGTGMMTETFFSGNQGNQQTTTATSNGILVILVPQIQAIQVSKIHLTFSGRIPYRLPFLKLTPHFQEQNLLFVSGNFCLPNHPLPTPSSLTPRPFVW